MVVGLHRELRKELRNDLPSALKLRFSERGYLLADGAMGTRLMASGLEAGGLPERWNRDHADEVISIHGSYISAGSDIILTNSFGGTAPRLAMHSGAEELVELNAAAVSCARRAIDSSSRKGDVYIAGSMGPTGQLLLPLGELSESEMEDIYYAQAAALASSGADMLWIETQMDLLEMRAALRAAHRTGLPYSATLSFDTAGKTMMGVSPEALVSFILDEDAMGDLRPWGFGLNCGLAAGDTLVSLKRMVSAMSAAGNEERVIARGLVALVKGNCGVPQWQDGAFRYSGSESTMGDYAELARALGAGVIGCCCGSGSSHVACMGARLGGQEVSEIVYGTPPSVDDIEKIMGEVKKVGADIDVAGSEPRKARRGLRRR